MQQHGSFYAHKPSYRSILFVQRHFVGEIFNFETSDANFPFFPTLLDVFTQGWKLARDEFLNKSHQASHASAENPLKMLQEISSPQIPPPSCQLFAECKQIVAVRGFEIIDTK